MIGSAGRLGALLCFVSVLASQGSEAQVPPPSAPGQAAPPDYLKRAQEVVRAAMKPPTFADIRPSTPAPPFKPGLRIAAILATARSTGAQLQARGLREGAAAVGWTTMDVD